MGDADAPRWAVLFSGEQKGMVGRVLSIAFVVFLVLVVLLTSGVVNKERAAFRVLEFLSEPVALYVVPRAFELLRLAVLLIVCVVVLWASTNSSRLDEVEAALKSTKESLDLSDSIRKDLDAKLQKALVEL
jgi:hypothetical protein